MSLTVLMKGFGFMSDNVPSLAVSSRRIKGIETCT